ncbi:MAG: amino acid permease [Thaumarchaeota archaeon]|nr:amino acid permease [Nitrososphaerota archaeon]
MAKPASVFLRDATGLIREIGPFDALILSLGFIVGPTFIVIFTGEWSLFPGVSVASSFLLMGALAAVHGYFYLQISSVLPRSASGGYVSLSRMVSPALGLGMSFIFVVAMIFNLGYIGSIAVPVGIAGPLTSYAAVTHNTGLASLASSLSTTTSGFITGSLLIIFVAIVAITGTKNILRANRVFFILGTLAFLTLVGMLLVVSQGQFTTAFNNYAGANAYQSTISAATAAGRIVPQNLIIPTLLSLPLSWFSLNGYQSSTYYSGEMKRVSRTMVAAIVGSIIYGAGLFALVAFLAERAFGSSFVQSISYLYGLGGSNYLLSVPPYLNTLLVIVNSNLYLNVLIMLGIIGWAYLIATNFIFVSSRHFLAWSFDRVFPSQLGRVSDRFHSPLLAIVVIAVISEIALIFYIIEPAYLGAVNLTYLFLPAILLDGFSGVFLVWRRKDLFASAPAIARRKLGTVPMIAITGLYSVIFIGILLAAALDNPAVGGPLGTITVATVVGSFILGLVSYFGMKAYHKRHGLDISVVFKEIPPE